MFFQLFYDLSVRRQLFIVYTSSGLIDHFGVSWRWFINPSLITDCLSLWLDCGFGGSFFWSLVIDHGFWSLA